MKEIQYIKTQLTIVVGFLVLSYLFDVPVLTTISLVLGLIFLISKTITKGILWLWWKIAHVLGWINTRILLSLVFYIFLLPIALLSRLFTKDPLNLKWSKKESTFVKRDHLYTAEDLENPW
jgi:hypothetical protein